MAWSLGMVVAESQPMNLEDAETAKAEIEQVLSCSPREYGIKRSRWQLKDIRQVVSWLQECTLSGVWQILKRLQIRLKQATGFVKSPDPLWHPKRRKMVQTFTIALHQPRDYAVLFQDELTYYSQQNEALVYGTVGRKPPYVSHSATENKMTRIGAVMDGLTGQVAYIQANKFGKMARAQLYRKVRQIWSQPKLFVIQDNCSFHYSHNVVKTAEQLDIIPIYIPTYASWLNPIEKLWRWLKADVLRGHEFAHDYHKLREVVAEFLDQFSQDSDALLRYAGLLPS